MWVFALWGCTNTATIETPPPPPPPSPSEPERPPITVPPDRGPEIEASLAACLGTPDGGTTYGMIVCTEAAAASWTEEEALRRSLLRDMLPGPSLALLDASSSPFAVFSAAESGLVDAVYGQLEGTMYLPMAAAARLAIVQQRAVELRRHSLALSGQPLPEGERDPCADRADDRAACRAEALASADAALNRVYRELLPLLPEEAVIRRAQRAWLPYRDAEIALTAATHRAGDREQREAQITRDRVHALEEHLARLKGE